MEQLSDPITLGSLLNRLSNEDFFKLEDALNAEKMKRIQNDAEMKRKAATDALYHSKMPKFRDCFDMLLDAPYDLGIIERKPMTKERESEIIEETRKNPEHIAAMRKIEEIKNVEKFLEEKCGFVRYKPLSFQ